MANYHQYKKNEEDPAIPSNKQPICLVTVFRKIIGAALKREIEVVYSLLFPQWGHRHGSGTECAVAFGVNSVGNKLLRAALLDLRKAHDLVHGGNYKE